jgi:prepilin peptidase CpaA
MSPAQVVPLGVVIVATLIAAVTDVWKFKVYNVLTLPLLVTGLIYHGVTGGAAGLADSSLGMLFGFGSLIALHALGGMGAGDVKLMAAIGAWLGMPLTFYVFMATSLAGGIYAVGLLFLSGGLTEVYVNYQLLFYRLRALGRHLGADDRIETEVNRPDRRRRCIPFAAMMAVGVIATLVWLIES